MYRHIKSRKKPITDRCPNCGMGADLITLNPTKMDLNNERTSLLVQCKTCLNEFAEVYMPSHAE